MVATYYILSTLFVIMSVFLILLVLIQKGRGGGLASAFGGAGGNTAFGSKTGDVLTWATSIVFGVFILLAVVTNLVANRVGSMGSAAAAAAATTSTPAVPSAQGGPGQGPPPSTPPPNMPIGQ